MTGEELSRCETDRAAGTDPEEVRALGETDDQIPIGEGARLAGVTRQYLRTMARRYEDHRGEVDQAVAAGRRPRRAFLVAHRGTVISGW